MNQKRSRIFKILEMKSKWESDDIALEISKLDAIKIQFENQKETGESEKNSLNQALRSMMGGEQVFDAESFGGFIRYLESVEKNIFDVNKKIQETKDLIDPLSQSLLNNKKYERHLEKRENEEKLKYLLDERKNISQEIEDLYLLGLFNRRKAGLDIS